MMKLKIVMLAGLLLFFCGCIDRKFAVLEKEMEEFCAKAVPDRRTDLCQVALRKGEGNTIEVRGELLSPELRDRICRLISEAGYQVADSLVVLPAEDPEGKSMGLISVSVANLRTDPEHGAELSTQAVMGTPVRILKRKYGWLYVQTPDRYLSWTNNSSVAEITSEALKAWNEGSRLLFTDPWGWVVRDQNSSERISVLVAGCIVKGEKSGGALVRVELPDGTAGFAEARKFTDFEEWKQALPGDAQSFLDVAKQYTGVPYMWGGTSSKAFDCSGFTKTVWFLNGIILERDASQQFKYGEIVEPGEKQENLQPGDLLFFGRKEPLRIIHVGIYAGNREVIHSSGQVWINSMDSAQSHFSRYLFSTFVGAKRVLGMASQSGYLAIKDHPWY